MSWASRVVWVLIAAVCLAATPAFAQVGPLKAARNLSKLRPRRIPIAIFPQCGVIPLAGNAMCARRSTSAVLDFQLAIDAAAREVVLERRGTTELLAEMRAAPSARNAVRVRFEGVGNKDVYNPTAPFEIEGKTVIAGRVESRTSETDTTVMFFERSDPLQAGGEVWRPIPGAPTFQMQDPFYTRIGGELVLGGVETYALDAKGTLGYRTVFMKGRTLGSLRRFAEGPRGMKDIRLAAIPDGRIAVFTRPQSELARSLGAPGERGSIGYTLISDLGELTPEVIETAPLLGGEFLAEEWGGVNEVLVLEDGTLGVLGHIAAYDAAGGRHYYPIAFRMDPLSRDRSAFRLLVERSQLPAGASKRPDLEDVLFSGGAIRQADGSATLFVGAGDAEVYRVVVDDPFVLK